MKLYEGRCHCRAIGYRFTTGLRPRDWSIRACQCRFCLAHAALSCSDPEGMMDIFAHEEDRLCRYRFGLRTADFLLCRHCGVYVGAVIESGNNRFGIINTRALLERPVNLADPQQISYEGENVKERSVRRAHRWTPVMATPWQNQALRRDQTI